MPIIAIIVLDQAVKMAKPLPVRTHGVAQGDRVRAVGFGRTGDHGAAGTKLVREHVRVLSVTAAELTVGEATCQGDSGGPALDESTGEVVGVVSRGGPSCEGAGVHNIYTRVDAFSWLVEEAFAKVAGLDREGVPDGGAPGPAPTRGRSRSRRVTWARRVKGRRIVRPASASPMATGGTAPARAGRVTAARRTIIVSPSRPAGRRASTCVEADLTSW